LSSVSGPGQVSQSQTSGPGPSQSSHKFHNPSSGGFGHSSHPALIQAGVSVGTNMANMQHMDQESSKPNSDINTYSQIGISKPGTIMKAGPATTSSAAARKPLADSAASSNRKPVLGKGVPPPVPPNKPVVPVKKDLAGKRSDSVVETGKTGSSVVAGLQGLKFGISLSSSNTDSKGMKPLGDTNVPAKKFFNNIESKS